MTRVFGEAEVTPANADGSTVRAIVDGWPDWFVYRTGPMIEVLGRYSDGHGTTEEGDSEICAALEDAGAFVSMGA